MNFDNSKVSIDQVLTTFGAHLSIDIQQFVGGGWSQGGGDLIFDLDPAHQGESVASLRASTVFDVDRAVRSAELAQMAWAALSIHERSAILHKTAKAIEANASVWGRELTLEEGKTLNEGVAEVVRAANIFRYAADEANREVGEIFESPRIGEVIQVNRVPLGVVACITPWNFPIAIPAWKIAPALIHGNAVVWKPSELTPLLAYRLTSALVSAGLPPGVLQLIFGGPDIGEALVDHPNISGVTFTGSTFVGKRIIQHCGQKAIPVQAEMGGNNAVIVLEDADVAEAADAICSGVVKSTGQKCSATSRILVHTAVYTELSKGLQDRFDRVVIGNPLDPKTEMGPLVSEGARKRMLEVLSLCLEEGGRLLTTVDPFEFNAPGGGHFVPAVLVETSAPKSLTLWETEVFGPLATLVRVDSLQEALDLANESEYGLSGAIFTNDLGAVSRAQREFAVGVLHVNSETTGADPHVPFGGLKNSGAGAMEQGRASREFFTQTRTTYLRAASIRHQKKAPLGETDGS